MVPFFLPISIVSFSLTQADLTWVESTASPESYSYYNYVHIGQNSDSSYPECIFLFGGSVCRTCSYCYNMTSDSLVSWGSIAVETYSQGIPNTVMIDDTIYYLSAADTIGIYDITTPTVQDVSTFSSWTISHASCIVQHPDYDNYLFIMVSHSTGFIMFDLNSGGTPIYIAGSDLSIERNWPSCAVNNYDDSNGDNDNYFYVIGGDSIYFERINLDDVVGSYLDNGIITDVEWEIINKTGVYLNCDMSVDCQMDFGGTGIRVMGATTYKHCIFIMGGETNGGGRQSNRETFCLDVENWQFLYLGNYIYYVEGHKMMYVLLFCFLFCVWFASFLLSPNDVYTCVFPAV